MLVRGPALPCQCPPPPPTAAKPGLSSEQTVTGMVLVRIIIPRNCRWFLELAQKIAPPHPLPTQMRMIARMLRTMTLMCILHASIPSVTVGSLYRLSAIQVSPSMCLNEFHSRRAGIMITIFEGGAGGEPHHKEAQGKSGGVGWGGVGWGGAGRGGAGRGRGRGGVGWGGVGWHIYAHIPADHTCPCRLLLKARLDGRDNHSGVRVGEPCEKPQQHTHTHFGLGVHVLRPRRDPLRDGLGVVGPRGF